MLPLSLESEDRNLKHSPTMPGPRHRLLSRRRIGMFLQSLIMTLLMTAFNNCFTTFGSRLTRTVSEALCCTGVYTLNTWVDSYVAIEALGNSVSLCASSGEEGNTFLHRPSTICSSGFVVAPAAPGAWSEWFIIEDSSLSHAPLKCLLRERERYGPRLYSQSAIA